MNPHSRRVAVAGALAALCLPGASLATNGYFAHGTSIKEKGLAGAGAAHSQDMLAAATNPAGMVRQGGGYDIGASLFNPNRSYSASAPSAPAGTPLPPTCPPQCPFGIGDANGQSLDSESTLFLIPNFGYNWVLDTESSVGVSVYGNGGMNTDYRGGAATLANPSAGQTAEFPGTFGAGDAGVDLSQLFVSTTYAREFGDNGSWGASLILAYQQFEAKGLANFGGFSTDAANLSNRGKDTGTGIGVRLGVQAEVAPGVMLGAAYQPKIGMSAFDKYAGLFAEQGDFDIPSNLTVGIAWHHSKTGTVVADVQTINYEDVAAISNPISALTTRCLAGDPTGCLGGANGAGFGWQNMTVIKLGYEWRGEGGWTWRAGISHGEQPIPSSEMLFNILAPGVVEQHLTFGFTREMRDGGELNFAAMHALDKSVSGASTFDPGQTIENKMNQLEFSLGYARRF